MAHPFSSLDSPFLVDRLAFGPILTPFDMPHQTYALRCFPLSLIIGTGFRMSQFLVQDQFTIRDIDPDGKHFSKGTCVSYL